MVFGMHTDDFDNDCGTGKFPLISAIRDTLLSNTTRRLHRKNKYFKTEILSE